MLAFDALVRRPVDVDVAEGRPAPVPAGHCRVEAHHEFVCLEWSDGRQTHSATVTTHRFEAYLKAGAILVLDAAQLARAGTRTRT
jgi:hypothetical protein